jgi:hypothetical protein
MRSKDWKFHSKPLHKKFSAKKPSEGQEIQTEVSLLNYLIQKLRIPSKGLPKKELYSWKNDSKKSPRPRDLERMGVGYKDKGSLGSGDWFPTEIPDPEESLRFEDSSLSLIWNEITSYFHSPI